MKNESKIAELTRKLHLGNHASHGVKAILGKMPINMNDARADQVLAALQEKYDATPEGQAATAPAEWADDMPHLANFRGYPRP